MLHIWSTYHDDIIWYYNNILISLTTIQTFCTLRTTFDIVCNALLTMGLTQHVLSKNICFYKYAHNSCPRGPQTWFWMHSTWNFTRKKMRYLPRPETHKQKYKNIQQIKNKNATQNGSPTTPARPRAWAESPGGGSPLGSGLNHSVTSIKGWSIVIKKWSHLRNLRRSPQV